jgi:glycosyltransferase involved in cell wall biosynthesis
MLSIIIPAFNEEKNIKQRILDIKSACKDIEHEIIVSDDGSTDMTPFIATSLGVIVLRNPHYGKGYAVKQGIDVAQGNKIAYIDCDKEISADYLKLADQYHVEALVGRKQGKRSAVREIGSRLHGFLVKKLFGLTIQTQTGFKIWDSKILKYVSKQNLSNGANFEVEYLFKAQKLGVLIYEYPIDLIKETRPSRFTMFNGVMSILDLFRLRVRLYLERNK